MAEPNRQTGIPTLYKGVQFRSRLEARWAAFFDQCSWPWTYEPFDLPGWIPDFQIGSAVLVEVKPYTAPGQFIDACRKAHHAMKQVGAPFDLLLLGVAPLERSLTKSELCPAIGWLIDFMYWGSLDDTDFENPEPAWFGPLEQCQSQFTFGHLGGGWCDRVYRIPHKNGRPNWCGVGDGYGYEATEQMWAAACNATQWKPPEQQARRWRPRRRYRPFDTE